MVTSLGFCEGGLQSQDSVVCCISLGTPCLTVTKYGYFFINSFCT